MANYAKPLPRDSGNQPMQEYPAPVKALAQYGKENASASSVITVTDNTTAIELSAHTTAAVMRWVASTDTEGSVISAVSGANFDHVIPINTVRRFVIPVEGGATQTSIVGANVANRLYKRVAIKSIGVGSVLATEY